MDLRNVKFLFASDEINKNSQKYWSLVIDIACKFNIERIKNCSQIMGRLDKEKLLTSQIMYPCMQCADIFFLKADICQLGMDQSEVNILAREYSSLNNRKKPLIISHSKISNYLKKIN